ncbi:MAG: hypothetical protein J6K58_16425 [Lachnospiraceae bacterium]|nr:hypothetical protein [Lachnospiraceae bacterium]
MNDTYVELLIKKPELKTAAWLCKIAIGLGAVLFLLGFFMHFMFSMAGVLVLGGGMICYWLTSGCIEYEYLYLDKELSVDKIRNRSKRKKVAAYDITTMEIMAPKGSHRLDSYSDLKVRDYSSETEEGNAFELVVEGENGRERIVIDTNEKLVKAIRMAAPRYVFTD